jgi:hypothetical protein
LESKLEMPLMGIWASCFFIVSTSKEVESANRWLECSTPTRAGLTPKGLRVRERIRSAMRKTKAHQTGGPEDALSNRTAAAGLGEQVLE